MTALDDLSWADAHAGHDRFLGEIFCLTFIRDVDGPEALRRIGGLPDTVATRTPEECAALHDFDHGYPDLAAALSLGTWTVLFEPSGFTGSNLVDTLSRGTEAVSVLRHDYASNAFDHAIDGSPVTGFDPDFPVYRHGTDPDRLLPHMRELGFSDEEDGAFDDHPIARALRLAELITGVLPSFEALCGPLPSAHVEPWFSAAPKPPAARPGYDGPLDAVAEARRLAALHGVTDTPELAEALAAAERAERVTITPDSPLGRHVRAWLTESNRAGWSLNDHGGRGRMTDADRDRAHGLGWLARALGAAVDQVT
ncbi:hypothetical protein GCM10022243_15710 [Saccharothrix violaceirubra]|uniref:Uncharacterized protein n=1 Tax=Saccharothrix violaceirubra TaxID=413306 RepID=A0A7W7T6G1_9PSEU|nr:DUF6461 domain-containing protein [Saccharothrix violaceirubra]MBB4967448.1 hypothetical protein [Saccharothrix violaceirubra]